MYDCKTCPQLCCSKRSNYLSHFLLPNRNSRCAKEEFDYFELRPTTPYDCKI
jgi:hypothetical protein